ncbi:type I restriction endonuclease subunit S [Shewanella sp. NFH-SH190041]|uniref:restriction endonuclease subunit S n=1 Tax=Shewanella sp. NFH-SH190041 TaxID=2950245 RepID=UPI0021C272F3|nr:restriction endonuclease subunit S [Shewanella sp. NFH-SH190041]BDM66089.1 type I restriction endonuclease subunit S [Shewanella sp. NFH-SH190041]
MNSLIAMPKYEDYKDSGIGCIADIPSHWEISRLKYVANIKNGDSLTPAQKELYSTKNESTLSYISSKDINVTTSEINYNSGIFVPQQEAGFRLANKNTTLLCIEGGSAGKKIAYTNREVYFVNKLACLFAQKANSKFLYYFIFSKPFQEQFKSSMSGLIGGVSLSSLNNFYICLPDLEVQSQIAAYLDVKVKGVDRGIAIKEQQIALLKERKQIIIQHAVTQGLNPDVPMKDSGVEWLRDIPEHWKSQRFKYLFTQSRLRVSPDDGVVTSYRDGQVTLRSNRRLDGYTEAILEGGYQGIRKGQLVLNSMDAFEGAIGVSDSDGKCTPEYVICDPISDEYVPEYFAYLLREMALARYIQVICSAVRQRAVRIRFNNLATRFLVVPPKSEQLEIVEHVKRESARIDGVIAHQTKQISKLKEYKTTLINAAVTGKIKVA